MIKLIISLYLFYSLSLFCVDLSRINTSHWIFSNLEEIKSRYKCIKAHDRFLLKLVIDDNNNLLATCSSDKNIKVWDLKTQALIKNIEEYNSSIISDRIIVLKITKCGRYLIVGKSRGSILIWDLYSNSDLPIHDINFNLNLPSLESGLLGLKIDYDRNIFIICSKNGTIEINTLDFNNINIFNNLKTIKTSEENDIYSNEINAFTINKDFFFIAKSEDYIKIYDLDNYKLVKLIKLTNSENIKKLYTLNNFFICVFSDHIKIYDVNNNFIETNSFKVKSDLIYDYPCINVSIGFNNSDSFILYIDNDNYLCRYFIDTKVTEKILETNNIICLKLLNDQLILMGDDKNNLIIYNKGIIKKLFDVLDVVYINKKKEIIKIKDISLGPISISKDGKYLVIASVEGVIRIMRLPDIYFIDNHSSLMDETSKSNCTIENFFDMMIVISDN